MGRKLRDIACLAAGSVVGLGVFYAGIHLNSAILEILGAPFPEESDALNIGAMMAVGVGFFVAFALGLQIHAGRRPRGVIHASALGFGMIGAAATLQALNNLISSEFLAIALCVLLTLPALGLFGMLWAKWMDKNEWLAQRMLLRRPIRE